MQADLQLVQATFQPVKAQVFPSCTLVFFFKPVNVALNFLLS